MAFQGRLIGRSHEIEAEAWLTRKGAIAAYHGDDQQLCVYNSYDNFAEESWPEDLTADIARALGEKHVEELDI